MNMRQVSLILILLVVTGSACSNHDHIVGPTNAVSPAEAARRRLTDAAAGGGAGPTISPEVACLPEASGRGRPLAAGL